MNGFRLHKDGAVTTTKQEYKAAHQYTPERISNITEDILCICGLPKDSGLHFSEQVKTKQKKITIKDYHTVFNADKILSRLSSLEERVSMIEDPMGMKYWYNKRHTVSVIQPKEDIREKIVSILWKWSTGSYSKKHTAQQIADKILSIVKESK